MVTLEPLDFNLPEDDYEKINLFLKDTQNFYMSLSEDYSDYFKDYSDNDKIIWNQLMNPLIEGIGKMTKLLENKTKYNSKLKKHGLLGEQLHAKLQLIKEARDEFLVAQHILQISDQFLRDIVPISEENLDVQKPWNKIKNRLRNDKKNTVKNLFGHIEILLNSFISALPGGKFLKEAMDFIKKILSS